MYIFKNRKYWKFLVEDHLKQICVYLCVITIAMLITVHGNHVNYIAVSPTAYTEIYNLYGRFVSQ